MEARYCAQVFLCLIAAVQNLTKLLLLLYFRIREKKYPWPDRVTACYTATAGCLHRQCCAPRNRAIPSDVRGRATHGRRYVSTTRVEETDDWTAHGENSEEETRCLAAVDRESRLTNVSKEVAR